MVRPPPQVQPVIPAVAGVPVAMLPVALIQEQP